MGMICLVQLQTLLLHHNARQETTFNISSLAPSSHCHETESDDVDQVTRLGVMTGDTVCVVVN